MKSYIYSRFYILMEVAAVVFGVYVGGILGQYRLIPRAILNLPNPDIGDADFLTTGKFFVFIIVFGFLLSSILFGPGVFKDTKRTAVEIYVFIAFVTLSALSLFLTTSIVFSPNLMLAIALSIFSLMFLSFISFRIIAPGSASASQILVSSWSVFLAICRNAIRPGGILVILFALSPLVLAKMFVSDRDFANQITQVRAFFEAQGNAEWALVNAFPGTVFPRPLEIRFPSHEKNTIYVLGRDGALIKAPYTIGQNISDGRKVKLLDLAKNLGTVEIENGAIGFDLHPEYGQAGSPNRGFAYVYYTAFRETHQVNRLSRFDLTLPTLKARMASETPIFSLRRNPAGFHNGGSVLFGSDGMLYVALGEAVERRGHQRLDYSLFGGIIRIDVDQRGGTVSHPIRRRPANGKTENYFIPSDNPFSGRPNSMEEFWAIGLRNPFRISFDPANGNLWAGDVGSDVWEEVNRIRKGGNYQFPFFEGRELQSGWSRPSPLIGVETPPVYAYRHTSFDRAVIGGIVYRGSKFPKLKGKYIFADSYSGKIFAFDANLPRVQTEDVTLLARAEGFLAQRGVTTVVQEPDGEIMLAAMGRSDEPSGQILRLVRAKDAPSLRSETVKRPKQTVTRAAAGEIFVADCSRCHGRTGRGDGPDAKSMVETFKLSAMPDFSAPGYKNKITEEKLMLIILKGGVAAGLSEGMPPWEDIYSKEEIEAVVSYVRSLSP